MKYRRLGNSDLDVSIISLGCMSLGTRHADNARIIHTAYDHGINFFDTADLYDKGFNEESVGKALKDRRDKVIIATKVGNEWLENGMGWEWNPHKSYIKEAIHGSLKRLGTDYIDLYQLHGGTLEDPIEETIEAFEELKQEGYIRHYGISSIRPNVIRQWTSRSALSSVMTQYSLLDRRPEEFTLNHLSDHQVGVIVRGVIAKGYLIHKPPMDLLGHMSQDIQGIQEKINDMAKGTPYSPVHLAAAYTLNHPATTTLTMGASNVAQVVQNAKLMRLAFPEEELIQALQNLAPAFHYDTHR